MHHPFLVGDRIYLRGIEHADLDGDYFQWLNDQDVTRCLEAGRFPNTPEAMEAYHAAKIACPTDVMFMIVLQDDDRPIGTIKLGGIHWVHRHAEFGIMIGAKDLWGQGYGTDAGRLVLEYAFRRLNLHKVFLGVAADHESAIRSYARLGFREEGTSTEYMYVDGRYRDALFMGITREWFYEANEKLADAE